MPQVEEDKEDVVMDYNESKKDETPTILHQS